MPSLDPWVCLWYMPPAMRREAYNGRRRPAGTTPPRGPRPWRQARRRACCRLQRTKGFETLLGGLNLPWPCHCHCSARLLLWGSNHGAAPWFKGAPRWMPGTESLPRIISLIHEGGQRLLAWPDNTWNPPVLAPGPSNGKRASWPRQGAALANVLATRAVRRPPACAAQLGAGRSVGAARARLWGAPRWAGRVCMQAWGSKAGTRCERVQAT
jgi:hypothetical protein